MDDFFVIDNEVMKNEFVIKKYNLLIWPLVRWELLYKIQQLKDNLTIALAKHPKLSVRNLKYIFETIIYAPHKLNKKFDIVFFVPARGRINNKNFNIYSDYYSVLKNNTLVVDNSLRGIYNIPHNTDNFATGDYGRLKSFIISQINYNFFRNQDLDIEGFINFIKSKDFLEERDYNYLKKKLYEFYFSYKNYKTYYSKFFKKIKPKIIFFNTGSYGQYNAIKIETAKENNILTAEFQHGTISKNHLAYNYGNMIFKSDKYERYLPEYILTYGDYWNEQMKIPCKKVTIGAPHFYESIKKYKNVKEKKKTILIVSQGEVTDKFVKIAKYLAENLPIYRIIFKLHPGEVPFEDRYEILNKYNNIQIVKSGDIYIYIVECENIVANYSTTIFEAMGFNKNIFILDNEASKKHIPKDIGLRFKEKEELKELIIQNEKKDIKYDLEYYFNSNWKENYERFINYIVRIK
jgi:hypothetical protein